MNCLSCKTYISNKRYCGNKCQQDYQYNKFIDSWLSGLEKGTTGKCNVSVYIRRWLHEKHQSKCQKCGWSKVHSVTNKVPLTINHIDGDALNNTPTNLELLCPNCHSLTPNYGSLNKGKSKRTYRLNKSNSS